jgi:hypothetical protein
MPQESDATHYRRVFVDFLREIHKLRADHDALMQTLMDEIPISERLRVLAKYDARRAELWEAAVLKLEDSLPSLAAELDNFRPLLPPDKKSGKP